MSKPLVSALLIACSLVAQQSLPEGELASDAGTGKTYVGPMSRTGTVPAAQRSTFGNANNNIPFSWRPTRYQQVFLGSELPRVRLIRGLGLRQDNGFRGYRGREIDLEIKIGYTTFDHQTVTNTFASNFNATPAPITVFPRAKFKLPDMPGTLPTDPNVFFIQIPFSRTFTWVGTNRNLLIEVVVYGNNNGNNLFTFPLDAARATTTTRVYASGNPTASTGTIGRGYGLVMCFLDKLSVTASYTLYGAGCKGTGPGNGVPAMTATGRPVINQAFNVDLAQARANAAALLVLGVSDKMWGAFTLPLDLTPFGAPNCNLLASFDLFGAVAVSASGTATTRFPIPNDATLSGSIFFNQYLVLDAPANALKVVVSNGGKATLGDQ